MPIAPRQPDDEEEFDWVRDCAMWFVGVEVEIFDSTRVTNKRRKRSAVGNVAHALHALTNEEPREVLDNRVEPIVDRCLSF